MEWKKFSEQLPTLEWVCMVYDPVSQRYGLLDNCQDLQELIKDPPAGDLWWCALPALPKEAQFRLCGCDDCE